MNTAATTGTEVAHRLMAHSSRLSGRLQSSTRSMRTPRRVSVGATQPQARKVNNITRLSANSPPAACCAVAPATCVSQGPTHSV